MPSVRIPTPLRSLTGGAARVSVAGHDVRAVLAALEAVHPGVAARLLGADGQLHRFVHVFVGDRDVRTERGLDTPVPAGATVSIVPAVAGG